MSFKKWFVYCLIVFLCWQASAQNCITCTSTHTTLSNGLVLCLPFNGGVTTDQAAAGFTGSALNSPSAVVDRLGNANGAFQLNGSNQYLLYGDILDTVFCKSPNAKFSISGWAKGTAPTGSNISYLVAKSAGAGSANQFVIGWDNAGKIYAESYSSGTINNYITQKTAVAVSNNTWFHFVYTFDGSASQGSRCKLYVNKTLAVAQAMVGSIGTSTQNTSQELTIGAGHAVGTPFTPVNLLNGVVDDIRIYNRILTNAEISELYGGTPLQITPMPDIAVCLGDSFQFNASAAPTYNWFPSTFLSATNISNPNCKPTTNKTYFVTITNGSCSNIDTVAVTLNQNCCVNSTSVNSLNSSMLFYMPVTNDARDLTTSPVAITVQGTGISVSSDRFNNASSSYSFTDVTTDRLVTPAVPKLSFPADKSFTFSLWAYARALRPGNSRILQVYKNGGFEIQLNSNLTDAGKITFFDYDGASSTTKVNLNSDSAISFGKWYHIVVTVSKDDSINKIYLNGRLSASIKSANSVQNSCGISVGNHNLNANGFDGKVDEVRVYNYALNQSEILDLYYLGKSHILNDDTTICSGDSVQINALGHSSSYSWSPTKGLNDPTILNPIAKPDTTTRYILTSTNGSCTFKDTVIIYVNIAVANAGTDTTVCFGDSVQLQGSGGANFLWSPAVNLSALNIKDPYASPSADQEYVLRVTTATCTSTDTMMVYVNHVIANAGPDVNMCFGDSIQLSATGGTDYIWAPYATLTNYQIANPRAFPADTQSYRVTVTSGFCSNTDTVKVNVIHINPNAGNDAQICPGDSVQLTASGGNSYTWITDPGLSDTTVANPWAKPDATRFMYVRAKIAQCSVIDSVKITVASTLTTNAGNDEEICYGKSVPLHASGGTSFLWTPATGLNDPTSADPVASPLDTIDYILKATSGNCVAYDTVRVYVNPLPQVYAGTDTFACKNQAIMLTPILVPSGVSCLWSPASLLDNANVAYPNAIIDTKTDFKLVATNPVTGCIDSGTVTVDVSTPSVSFSMKAPHGDAPFKAEAINHSAPEPMTYLWTFVDSVEYYSVEKNPSYIFSEPGVYYIYLSAMDQYGCIGYDTASVEVYDVVRFFLPNAFTPNGDHNNELFKPVYSTSLVTSITGTIWNKWGETVYEMAIPGGAWWDGKSNNNLCPEGVYYYQIKVTDYTNRVKTYRGTVTLLR